MSRTRRTTRTPLTGLPLSARDRERYPYDHPEHGAVTEDEASRLGYDTPINRREFLEVSGKLGLSAFAVSTLYPTFLASCGRTLESATTEGFGESAATGDIIYMGLI